MHNYNAFKAPVNTIYKRRLTAESPAEPVGADEASIPYTRRNSRKKHSVGLLYIFTSSKGVASKPDSQRETPADPAPLLALFLDIISCKETLVLWLKY